MAQKLILPINDMRITAGYKNANYKKQFGYNHYGVDCTDAARQDKRIWASGNGTIMERGESAAGGNVIIVVYKDCLLPDGSRHDITMRYSHLEKFGKWRKGDTVNKDCILGYYGNTGMSSGAHLHIECDLDTQYYAYTPQISKNSGVLKKGTDSTLDPVKVLWKKKSKPDYQTVVGSTSSNCYASKDLAYKEV